MLKLFISWRILTLAHSINVSKNGRHQERFHPYNLFQYSTYHVMSFISYVYILLFADGLACFFIL